MAEGQWARSELADHLERMLALHDFGRRLSMESAVQRIVELLLDSAIALVGADGGMVQLRDTEDDLVIALSRGLPAEFLAAVERIRRGQGACGTAFERKQRVVVEDVETDPLFEGLRELAVRAGFHAVQATPMFTRTGEVIGTVSTHFAVPHRPTDRELGLLDLYVQHAAAAIENARLHEAAQREIAERRRAEAALRSSETELGYALRAGRMGRFAWDLETGHVRGSKEDFRQIGLMRGDEVPTYSEALERVHPDDRPQLERIREGAEPRAVFRIVWPDGRISWLEGRGHVERAPGGHPQRITGILIDVSERMAADAALRENEERLRLALEAGRMGMWEWDLATKTVTWNEAGHDLMGLSRDGTPLTTDTFFARVHPEDLVGLRADLDRLVRDGGDFAHEFRVVRPDGAIRWLVARGGLIRDRTGRPVRVVGISFDSSDRKLAEAEREALLRREREARAEADRGNRAKDEFVAMLAHELRNPLAPIRNSVAVLRLLGLAGGEQVRLADVIDRQVSHMTRLLDDLLDVSRITRGRITLTKRHLPLGGIVAQAIETARELIGQKRHDLRVILPAEPLWVEADEARLVQVVANLVTNAAKFTPPGGTITVVGEAADGRVVLRVRDNGVGIAVDAFDRIFELFAQEDVTLDRQQGGLGIGLTLVKRLVEMHGGRVEARSAGPGRGSEFVVTLPALPAPGQEALPERRPLPAQGRRRVLIVEDNFDTAETVATYLRLLGHEVLVTHDGPTALERTQALHPDVALIDIGLPGMSGYELVRALQAASPVVPQLIAMTGYGRDEDRPRARRRVRRAPRQARRHGYPGSGRERGAEAGGGRSVRVVVRRSGGTSAALHDQRDGQHV
jgi:PAS domain S-box-containing protein